MNMTAAATTMIHAVAGSAHRGQQARGKSRDAPSLPGRPANQWLIRHLSDARPSSTCHNEHNADEPAMKNGEAGVVRCLRASCGVRLDKVTLINLPIWHDVAAPQGPARCGTGHTACVHVWMSNLGCLGRYVPRRRRGRDFFVVVTPPRSRA
jgi:hypothetical protein